MLLRRHFWRHATFSEIAELYASRVLRMAAIQMSGAFIAIYLYQNGYSIAQIAFYWAAFFGFKVLIALPAAALVAQIGPKHGVLFSNLLYIPAMVGFVFLPIVGPAILIPILIIEGISSSIYTTSYSVDFSKIKSLMHAGKEIGYMNIVDKVTAGLSPLVGGFIAFIFGPEVVIVVAATLFAFAASPLLRTGEPTRTHQRLHFRGFSWSLFRKHAVAQVAYGYDILVSGRAWSLFVAVVIVGVGGGDEVYAIVGTLLSVVFIVSFVTSYLFGQLIDAKRGASLMQLSILGKAITHLVRPFVPTPLGAAGMNAVNETATTGYVMPYTRAIFDNADRSGNRITYIGLTDAAASFGAACAALVLGFIALSFSEESSFSYAFIIAAGVVLLLLTARFPLYRRR